MHLFSFPRAPNIYVCMYDGPSKYMYNTADGDMLWVSTFGTRAYLPVRVSRM